MTDVRLLVESVPLSDAAELQTVADFLAYADHKNPLVWLRTHAQAVGIGVAARLQATGAARFAELNHEWQKLIAQATVHDMVQLPGSGLVAFGAISYADNSEAVSELIVPAVTLHRHENTFFITRAQVIPATAKPSSVTAFSDANTTKLAAAGLQRQDLNPVAWSGVRLNPDTKNAAACYNAKAKQVLSAITHGKAQKVVLARQIAAHLPANADLRVPILRLAQDYSNCTVFAINGFLGASPETLARNVSCDVTARVLAGTSKRNLLDAKADQEAHDFLLNSAQINAEHKFAADSVISALTPLVKRLDTNTRPLVIPLPNVWHRATDIRAQIAPETSLLGLVAAMHPTAAVAGTPTAAAQRIIAEVEGFDRGYYAGAVGWISAKGDGEWALALRCAQVATPLAGKRVVTATAGGGLVADSTVSAEFAETIAKFAPIVSAFN